MNMEEYNIMRSKIIIIVCGSVIASLLVGCDGYFITRYMVRLDNGSISYNMSNAPICVLKHNVVNLAKSNGMKCYFNYCDNTTKHEGLICDDRYIKLSFDNPSGDNEVLIKIVQFGPQGKGTLYKKMNNDLYILLNKYPEFKIIEAN